MPIYSSTHAAPASTASYKTLKEAAVATDATNTQVPSGQVDAYFNNPTAVDITIVFNATTAALALAEAGAARTFNLSAGLRLNFPLRIDPNTTWVRSTDTSARNFVVTYNW